jgi:hypothetical protein
MLSPEAAEVLAKAGRSSLQFENTPLEKVNSRFLSNTKSTQDKTFDTNSMKKKTTTFHFSNNKHVEKLDLEKEI